MNTKKIGVVSLGCPKALVDSERIITRLRAEGYEISPDYQGADAVLVNTCGFLDSARAESLDAIGEAIRENGKVIVTGCLGAEPDVIMAEHPKVLAVTGPQQYEQVLGAIHDAIPPEHKPFEDLVPASGIRLTPRHYAYLKISEGCDNRCSFCIIPFLRGDLVSRPANAVIAEAENLVRAGVKELLVVSQDTSAYGRDIKYATSSFKGKEYRAKFYDLAAALGELGVWVRMHYVYPYPHVDEVIPLMAQGKILPYLDIPFQHASPRILKKMVRPANIEKQADRIKKWREICPDLCIRSSFIVGFPGETEEDFGMLVDFVRDAEIDRIGVFKYENVVHATSRDFDEQIPEDVKQSRWERLMEVAQEVSAKRLTAKVGREVDVIVDEIDEDGTIIARTIWDAPEVDGNIFIDPCEGVKVGDTFSARIDEASEYDLYGVKI
ncbi:30S ribosomal protein S12 methylthiotransferase RimO [Pseudaquidulcibacter saccharophilus]|uniref:30S ribosomal protein S12 methylthiotransferase RimO n=1 Tax=Pseudaquidulcibacter saccharophilus TaxID=2831900 RepID=UPI001EFEF4FF|nr:30S ribosomal protein S12 methylthiotransferase RimO [Pseudaquidulcibacter saccharophilus]